MTHEKCLLWHATDVDKNRFLNVEYPYAKESLMTEKMPGAINNTLNCA